MVNILVCRGCEELLSDASYALRRHSAAMSNAILSAERDSISQEEFENYRTEVRSSFKEAQERWDAYREHLVEHGLLLE